VRAATIVACALTCASGSVPAVASGARSSGSGARALAATAAATPTATATERDPAARAREQAREVLAQRRFQPAELPTPLRSVRERIGAAVREAGRPFEAAYRWVASWFPGGPPVLLALLAGAILAGAAAIAARAGARRARAHAGAGGGDRGERNGREVLSADRLRDEAERAERRGDLEAALRLRFRAGLVELDSRELIELRPALTNHELLRAVPSPTLASLVDGFEAVAYGGRPAVADDLDVAREGWPRVAEEVGAP